MVCYDRIDISEGIDIIKENASKKCHICHYRYFLDKGLSFSGISATDVVTYYSIC